MTNVLSLANAASKKPILLRRPKRFPISRDSLDLDEDVLVWLAEAEKNKTFIKMSALYEAILKSCVEAIEANPNLGSRVNELYSDIVDCNVNALLYTGKYQIEGYDAPDFWELRNRPVLKKPRKKKSIV